MKKALVTVYFPTKDVRENVILISQQVDEVYICDNSPSDHATLFNGIPNLHYVFFAENRGLSGAFNAILKDPQTQWDTNDYVLFFDQDSSIKPAHIQALVGEYESLEKTGIDIGCIGPAFYNTSKQAVEEPRKKVFLNDSTYDVSSVITSSMLCKYQDLEAVGFWNDEVFLDMADWDLCWRFMTKGMHCCMTRVAVLRHTLGNGEKKIGPFSLRVGSVFREYYQIRDGLYLLFKPYTPVRYRVRVILNLFVRSVLHLLFLNQRRLRIRYICMGIKDYFLKKRGPVKMLK